jgi:hypothetical protein
MGMGNNCHQKEYNCSSFYFATSFHTLLSRSNGASVFCFLSSLPLLPQPPQLCLVQTSERLERGGPLLTLETELNGDSKRTNERGPILVSSLGLACRYKILFTYLPWLV